MARISNLTAAVALMATITACQDGVTDPEDTRSACESTTPIAVGQSRGGTLGQGDCDRFGTWTDRWSLDLSAEASVRIDLSSGAFDAYLELLSSNGLVIAENDDAGSLDSRIIETLPAGSYVIVARSLGQGQSGPYTLSVTIGPDCRPVGTIHIGDRVSGEVTPNDCLFQWGGLMDNWRFELTRPTGVRIEVESDDFDETLVVTDERGEIQWVLDGFGPLGVARGDLMLDDGSYTLSAVSVFETPGSYELRVDLMPPCLPGTSLVLGETLTGTIDEKDCLLFDWAPADSLVLELDRDTPMEIVVKSSDITPFLHVRDAEGNEVAWGGAEYDPTTGQPAGIARTSVGLEAGFYSVYVASEGYPSPWGEYQITVSEVVCDVATPITFDTTVVGALESGDCFGVNGAYLDRYDLVLASDTTVRIDLESSAFDAFLRLSNSSGAVVAEDDDGGTGLNSRIEIPLSAGSYVIAAGALLSRSTGSYSLTVGPPAPAPSAAEVSSRLKVGPETRGSSGFALRATEVMLEAIARSWGRAGKVPRVR
jgi:hypothetical protein